MLSKFQWEVGHVLYNRLIKKITRYDQYKCKRVQQQFITQYLSKQLIETIVNKNEPQCMLLSLNPQKLSHYLTAVKTYLFNSDKPKRFWFTLSKEDQSQFFFFSYAFILIFFPLFIN